MRAGILMAAFALFTVMLTATQPTVRRLDGSAMSYREIDATVLRLMGAAEVTGTAIAILHSAKVEYLKDYGYRDKDKKLPLTEDSVMAGASFTKAAFAYLVMQLVDNRTLDLDKPVHEYLPKPLPDYPAYRDLEGDPRYKRITARMLLSHTSRFPQLSLVER